MRQEFQKAGLVVTLLLATAFSASASALTSEFRLIDIPCAYQCSAGVAINSSRVYTASGGIEIDGDEMGIFVRAIEFTGTPVGDSKRLNAYTVGNQYAGGIARAGENVFSVWSSDGQDGSGYAVVGTRIGNDGSPVGGERILSETLMGDQWASGIAGLENGDHLVLWYDAAEVVWGRIFDAVNEPLTGEFEIPLSGDVDSSGFGLVSNGVDRFLVLWRVFDPLTEKQGLRFRLLDASGDFLGPERSYESETSIYWSAVDFAMNRDGEFAVVWDPGDPPGVESAIVMQRFDEEASAIGGPIAISEGETISQDFPSIAMTEDGHAFVAWMVGSNVGGPSFANSHSEIAAVWLDPDGNKIGEIFQANESTYWAQQFPDVAVNSDGVAAVVWTTYDELDGEFSLWGRLFQYDGDDLGPDGDDDEGDDSSEDSGDDDDGGCGC